MLTWHIKSFKELSQEELYEALKIRAEIFVVEQNCPYNDLDNKDHIAKHVLGKEGEKIVAYSRIFKEGDFYKGHASIGRILISGEKRKKKIGNELVEKSINYCKENFPGAEIKISAQFHLKSFYQKAGFVYKGETYLEDGIPHCSMYHPC